MSKVIAIVGARLNSSRLPRKHLLSLAGKPLIARIFERLDHVPEIDRIVLATTDDTYNQPLVQWAERNRREVFPFSGDVNDLVARLDAVVKRHDPDFLVYVCGDCPLLSPEIISAMIQAMIADPTAQLAGVAPDPNGKPWIHEGFDVYARSCWDLLVAEASTPETREHVGASLRPYHAKLPRAWVAEDPALAFEHRISVDTPSDYRFMCRVYEDWYESNPAGSIVPLSWVVARLQVDETLREMNRHVRQKVVGDHSASIVIVTAMGPQFGMGNFKRSMRIAAALQDKISAGASLLIAGQPLADETSAGLELIPHRFVPEVEDLPRQVIETVLERETQAVVFDLPPTLVNHALLEALPVLNNEKVLIASIDRCLPRSEMADLHFVPSFYLAPNDPLYGAADLHYGWDCFILPERRERLKDVDQNRLLVLTGAADAYGFGQVLPEVLDEALPECVDIDWVLGPFAEPPILPASPKRQWRILAHVVDMREPMLAASLALSVYGVSFFECLGVGLPTVALIPPPMHGSGEIRALLEAEVAPVALDNEAAVQAVMDLLSSAEVSARYIENAGEKLDGDGASRFAKLLAKKF